MADRAGTYALTLRYSNEEQAKATHYNPDPLARIARIAVNGGEPILVSAPHSFNANNWWEMTGARDAEGRGQHHPHRGRGTAQLGWPDLCVAELARHSAPLAFRSQYRPDHITPMP